MRNRSTPRSVAALGLVALLCALSTGLPSHHHAHAASAGDGDAGEVVEAGDHHAHGVDLVEQLDRVPQTLPHVVPPTVSGFEPVASVERLTDPTPQPRAAPTGRSPPAVSPRAPPLSA